MLVYQSVEKTGCLPLACFEGMIPVPETNGSHLNMDGWNTSFLLGSGLFSEKYVSFREGIISKKNIILMDCYQPHIPESERTTVTQKRQKLLEVCPETTLGKKKLLGI